MKLINYYCVIILSILFLNLDAQAQTLDFKISEMKLPTIEEWNTTQNTNTSEINSEIIKALQSYHDTLPFTQTIPQFQSNPNEYIENRINALENLISVINTTTSTDEGNTLFEELKFKAQNKIKYLQALPDMTDSRFTKPEALPEAYQSKIIKLKDNYAFEALDPHHRWGHEISMRINRWEASDIPNYFIFLELMEYDLLINKYAPGNQQVKYYSQEERETHRLTFKDGLWYLRGNLFDTTKFYTFHSGDGYAIFLLGLDKEIYVNNHVKYKIHHSSEFAGNDVLAGGEIHATNGKITLISNKSGHYAPAPKDLLEILAVLKEKIGSLKDIQVSLILRKPNYNGVVHANYDAEEMLSEGAPTVPLNAKYGWTPLHVIVWDNKIKFAEQCFNPKDINAKNDNGDTPLHIATQEGYPEWIKFLLEHGANAKLTNKAGNTPLHLAARNGDLKSVELLMPHSDGELPNAAGDTPLLLAVRSGNLETFASFASKGFSQESTDFENNHILFYGVNSKCPSMLQLLLKNHRKKLQQRNHSEATLLHFAAAFSTPEIIKLLVEEGLAPDVVDNRGNSMLHYAAIHGNGSTSNYILDSEYSQMFWKPNNQGALPFHYGAASLGFKFLKRYVEVAGTTELFDNKGHTPIFYAAQSPISQGSKNIHLLANNGANLQIQDPQGLSAIHLAAKNDDPMSVMRISSHAPVIDLLDEEGNSPLNIALKAKVFSTAQYLIEHTDRETLLKQNYKGQTALDIARKSGNAHIINLIEQKIHGSESEAADNIPK